MEWSLVQQEKDIAQYLREADAEPQTSPPWDDLNERAQHQVSLVSKVVRGLLKADAVSEGLIRVNASGRAHPDAKQGPAAFDYIAFSIGRIR
jgi:hypothetical protein